MHKNKFISVLKTLSQKELKEFNHFLTALYSSNKIPIHVFKYIFKHLPKILEDRIGKQDLMNHNTIKQFQLNDKSFSRTLSKLHQILEEFLIWKSMQDIKSYERGLQMIKVLKDRKLDALYFKQISAVEKEIAKKDIHDSWDNLKSFELEYFRFFHTNTQKLSLSIDSLSNGMRNLDLFFILKKLKYACEMLNRANILQEHHRPALLSGSIDYCNSRTNKLPILHKLYLMAYELLNTRENQAFIDLKTFLVDQIKTISKEDKAILVGYLINYVISKVKEGGYNYNQDIFNFYELSLKEDLILEDGFISPLSFINIVNIASILNKYLWVEKFIEDHTPFLSYSLREHTLQISFAYISFSKRNFNSVIEHLRPVEFQNNIDFALRSKSLILRSQYELDKKEPHVFDTAKAFELYISRNKKINKLTLDAYANFIKSVKHLLREKVIKEKLLRKIRNYKVIYFREWLLEKVLEL